MILAILKFCWALVLPYAGPLIGWAGPKLSRVAGLGAVLGIPSGLALPVLAGGVIATALALGVGWMGWHHAREARAETAFVNRCNGHILAANSKAMREALARAAAAEAAASKARAEGEILEARAEVLTAELDKLMRERPGTGPGHADNVCLPDEVVALVNGASGARKAPAPATIKGRGMAAPGAPSTPDGAKK